MLVPKLITTLKGYTFNAFLRDAGAGVIVGIVALPLSIAFAIASGVSPERGLITAIIAGFIISLLGGSRVQIGGPTGAFIVVVYGVVEKYGVDGLIVTTILAGILLIAMGLLKLGAVIKFIPAPVITGFTSGIAVIIFSSQIKDFLGLKMGNVPADFVEKWTALFGAITTADLYAVGLGVLTILIIGLYPRLDRRIPSPFVALMVTTVLASLLGLNVETIGSKFGEISASFPSPHIPSVTYAMIKELVPSVFTIAILAAIESLLSAVVADGMLGTKHRSNMELVAQGVANVVTPLFGGIAATGAIARTATNIKSGGRTPIAGIVHSITLLVIMLAFGKLAARIPMATLAGILVVVAYNMSEWRSFRAFLRAPKSDVAVLVTTFLLTVLIDLTVAIEIGMVLAAFLFMRRMSEVASVEEITAEMSEREDDSIRDTSGLPLGTQVFEVRGAFFFGAVEKFNETIIASRTVPKVLIMRMGYVPAIDATGIKALSDINKRLRGHGGQMIFCELQPQPLRALEQSGFLDTLGREHVVPAYSLAIDRAREYTKALLAD
ncbi:MAG TPA: SulP family inorganic anion transporter [Candidatus Kapabacteria bacterium]|nr:SulP family inorganic anion transporter [Candidatus Kapabacteria bacterium]